MAGILWNFAGTGLFALSCAALVLRWLWASGVPLSAPFSDPLPPRRGEVPSARELYRVFLLALLFRVAWALGSLVVYNAVEGAALPAAQLPGLWARWDAPHYLKLVELGYGGYIENGQPLFLVFFPLYVWVVRALSLVLPDPALSGMLVSFFCYAWGCVYLYRLVAGEYGSIMARRTLLLLSAFPFSFFFGGIMTESLFFLTTAAGLYHIRRHQWGRFALWGVLAAMTRMQGVILIGAAVAELCNEVRPFALSGKERRTALLDVGKRLPLLCVPVLGSGAYLLLNWCVIGNPFAFTEMQKHWSQGFQWFPSVLAYLAKNALTWPKASTRWEMWIPELVLFPLFALLLWRGWKKHRSMYTLYGFVYLILNYCLSWLLSAGRYLSCGIPFFLVAADELEGKPRRTVALVVLMLALQGLFCYWYLTWRQVM